MGGACILLLLLLLFSIRPGVIVLSGWKRQEERDWEREEDGKDDSCYLTKKRNKDCKDGVGETQNFVRL